MATRSSGRGEERPNTRSGSSAGSNASSNAGGTSTGRRDNTSTAQSSEARQNAGTSNESNRTQGTSTGSTGRGEQERQLQTSREQPQVRGGGSRGNASQQQNIGYSQGYVSGSSPFAMMRRMMDDMDRLFSDFGFGQPGLLASSFFGPETWSPFESRALGSSQAGGSQRALSGSSGGQGLQRGDQRGLQSWSQQGLWAPQVEVLERGNNLVVRADLPGLNREDVDVEVDNDSLIIRGERRSDFEDEREGYYRSERSYGSFYRAIPLPEGVDPNACNATFKDGVLEVTLPKPPESKSQGRKIQVK